MCLDLEDRILDHLLYGAISVSQVDGMRRTVPFARDVFDRFIFCATQYWIYKGTWDTFAGGGIRYLAALRNEPRDLDPQRVPPGVAALVDEVMLRFRPRQPGEDITNGHQMTTVAQQRLGEELMLALGGDYGDGVHAAGTRTYSKMMSARIGDGFVHPVIGGWMWSDILAAEHPAPSAGREVTVLPTIADAVETWRNSPSDRPRCERIILDRARELGWRNPLR